MTDAAPLHDLPPPQSPLQASGLGAPASPASGPLTRPSHAHASRSDSLSSPPDSISEAAADYATFDRRALLRHTAAAGAAATIAGFWFEGFGNPLRRRFITPTPAAPGKTFSAAEWTVLEAALDRLVPSGPGSPGAKDVNAIGYLDAVLQEPDFDPARFSEVVKGGVPKLEEEAQKRGAATFPALAEAGQIEVLKGFEAHDVGRRWLRRMMWFALEALLGDPVHGCQPGEVGWKWLAYKAGGPRPTTPNWRPDPK